VTAQAAHMAVLCTGRLYCDLVMAGLSAAPEPGREVYANGMTLAAGGGAYITAAYLAALGVRVGLAAMLPVVPFDAAIGAEMRASGIDLSLCEPADPQADPQITVAMITDGDRAFVTRRSGLAVPRGVLAALQAGRYAHLHIGELASLIETPGLIAAARSAGMSVSVDCAWDAEVLARKDLVAQMRGIDVFLPNRAEAEALSNHAALTDLAPLVVIKDGANGAEALTAAGRVSRPVKLVRPVDTVGAGDAFNAGFLDAWLAQTGLAQTDMAQCLDAGAETARVALMRSGGAGGLVPMVPLRQRHSPAAE
jgi:sugar/nucleoside kinase (ribokinase family)